MEMHLPSGTLRRLPWRRRSFHRGNIVADPQRPPPPRLEIAPARTSPQTMQASRASGASIKAHLSRGQHTAKIDASQAEAGVSAVPTPPCGGDAQRRVSLPLSVEGRWRYDDAI